MRAEPNEKQIQFWLNRLKCKKGTSEEDKRSYAIRKFHDMCAEEMMDHMQETIIYWESTEFKNKVAKPDIELAQFLTLRILSAQPLLASHECLADNFNGEILNVEIEEEFKKFFDKMWLKYEFNEDESHIVDQHQQAIENYFYHFHRIRVPIHHGLTKKYWDYTFGPDKNHVGWEDGEDHKKPWEDPEVASMPKRQTRKSDQEKLNTKPTNTKGKQKRKSTDLYSDEEFIDMAGDSQKPQSKKNAP